MARSICVLVAFVVGVGGMAACGSSTKTASAPTTVTTTPSFHTITLQAVEHDLSLKESGNTVTIFNNLLSNGKKVGEGQVECFLSGRGAVAMCLGAAVFPDGQILSDASLKLPPVGNNVDAIVGGTGKYAGARGTIDLVRATPTADTNVTFHIRLDS